MKKLFAVLALLLGFAFTSNAQDKKMSAVDAAKLDAVKMTEALGLEGTQQDDFVRLFVMKHQTMNDPAISAEKKKEFSAVVEAKIKASLTPAQTEKLNANPALMAKLTGTEPAKK